jgi:hypothetical protein
MPGRASPFGSLAPKMAPLGARARTGAAVGGRLPTGSPVAMPAAVRGVAVEPMAGTAAVIPHRPMVTPPAATTMCVGALTSLVLAPAVRLGPAAPTIAASLFTVRRRVVPSRVAPAGMFLAAALSSMVPISTRGRPKHKQRRTQRQTTGQTRPSPMRKHGGSPHVSRSSWSNSLAKPTYLITASTSRA